jgi:hypothetical protein
VFLGPGFFLLTFNADNISSLKHLSNLELLCCLPPKIKPNDFGVFGQFKISKPDFTALLDTIKAILPESTKLNVFFDAGGFQRVPGSTVSTRSRLSLAAHCVSGQTDLELLDHLLLEGYDISKELKNSLDAPAKTALGTLLADASVLGTGANLDILKRFLTEDKYNQVVFDYLPGAVRAQEQIQDILFSSDVLELSASRLGWQNLDPLATYYSSACISRCNLLTHVLDVLPGTTLQKIRYLTEYDRAKMLRIDARTCSPFFAQDCSSLIYNPETLGYFFFDIRANPNLTDDAGRTVAEHLASITHQLELNAFVSVFKPKVLKQEKPFTDAALRKTKRSDDAICVLARGLCVDDAIMGLVNFITLGSPSEEQISFALAKAAMFLQQIPVKHLGDKSCFAAAKSIWKDLKLIGQNAKIIAQINAFIDRCA